MIAKLLANISEKDFSHVSFRYYSLICLRYYPLRYYSALPFYFISERTKIINSRLIKKTN